MEPVSKRRGDTVLLIQMPWATTQRPSIALGILSALCKENDTKVKTIYPNFDMAHLIGFKAASRFANERTLYGLSEHLFAVDIFGLEKLASDTFLHEFNKLLHNTPEIEKEWGFAIGEPTYLTELRDKTIPQFLDTLVKRVIEINPKVVGFSATFNQVMPGLALANRIKQVRPDITTIFGGASYDGEMGVEYHRALPDIIDHVFIGEAEKSFVEFLNRINYGKSTVGIPGVSSVVDGKVELIPGTILEDMNNSPRPDYDDFFSEVERMLKETGKIFNIKYISFEGSRGCWWGNKNQCLFCGINPETMKFRPKKVERIISDIVILSSRYKSTDLSATDLVLPIKLSEELFDSLKKLDLDINLFYEVRVNMKKRQIKNMYDAGIKSVQPGIESFSTPVLKIMRKGTTSLQNIQFLRWITEIGISASYNILAGFPGEEEKWYFEMAEIIKHICHIHPPKFNIHKIEMHRFSPLFNNMHDYGVEDCTLRADYFMNFPLGVVDPMKIGYFFSSNYGISDIESSHYQAVKTEIQKWIEMHDQKKQPVFKYQIGPGYIKITDNRFGEGRFVHLADIPHDVFLLCDEIRSRESINRYLYKKWPDDVQNGNIDRIIDELVENDILKEEDNHFLALPLADKYRDSDELKEYAIS